MPKGRKRAVLAAALLLAVSAAQAAPNPLGVYASPIIVDVQPGSHIDMDDAPEDARIRFGGTQHDEDNSGLQTRQFDMQVSLSCRISEDDLIILNTSQDAIAAGSTIKWQIKGSPEKGYLAMKEAVPPGKAFRASGVLTGGEGQRCSARAV